MAKKILFIVPLFLLIFTCKSFIRESDNGNFRIINNSDKVIEYIWLTREGDLYPVARNINVGPGQSYDIESLDAGLHDIAIDFLGEYNSFNSKKDKTLCLKVEKGITKVWVVDQKGKIIRN